MEKSILDYIYGSGAVLDEKTPDPRDWIEQVPRHDEMVCLAITLTTTIKTSTKLFMAVRYPIEDKGTTFPAIVVPQGKRINKMAPHHQYKWFKEKISEIFGNYNYYFVMDWQKNKDKLVHVHGISFCPRHIKDMYIISVKQRAEVILQAKQHDVREVYELQNWIDYITCKTGFPSITHL